jgi:hypothetical protein
MSAMPIYTSISIGLPSWLLKQFQNLMRAFFWMCTNMVQSGKCLVAWCRIQRPLHLGGLGMMDLRLLGVALCARWLWLHLTDPARAWTALRVGEDSLTKAFFVASIWLQLGGGTTFLFWTDPWLGGAHLANLVPDLVAATSKANRRCQTVASVLLNQSWVQDITDALTIPVIIQYIEIRQQLQQVQLAPGVADKFLWRWEASGNYSCRSAYRALFYGQTTIQGATQLWKSRVRNKCRFFARLVLLCMCWTAEQLHHHGLSASAECTLCAQEPEHIDHLTLNCPFAWETWHAVLHQYGWHVLTPVYQENFATWWLHQGRTSLRTTIHRF